MVELTYPDELIDNQFRATLAREGITPREDLFPLDASGSIVRFAVMNDRPGEKSGAYYLHADGFPNWGVMEYGRHDRMIQDKFRFDRMSRREQDILRAANPQACRHEPESPCRRSTPTRPQPRESRAPVSHVPTAAERPAFLRAALRQYREGVTGSVVETHPFVRRKFTEKGFDLREIAGFNLWGTDHLAATAPRVSGLTGNLLFPIISPVTGMFHGLHWLGHRPAASGHWAKGFVMGTSPMGASVCLRPDSVKREKLVYVCEGIATGLAVQWQLWRQTGEAFTVHCALSAGNIVPLCTALRSIDGITIVIAADNDAGTEKKTGKNPGLAAAQQAKEAGVADVIEHPAGRVNNVDFYDLLCSCTH